MSTLEEIKEELRRLQERDPRADAVDILCKLVKQERDLREKADQTVGQYSQIISGQRETISALNMQNGELRAEIELLRKIPTDVPR